MQSCSNSKNSSFLCVLESFPEEWHIIRNLVHRTALEHLLFFFFLHRVLLFGCCFQLSSVIQVYVFYVATWLISVMLRSYCRLCSSALKRADAQLLIRQNQPSLLATNPFIEQRRNYTAESIGVLVSVQDAIVSLHKASATPWWATIALSTVVVRTALFPLVRYQLLASRKLSAAVPEINFLFQLLRNRLKHIPSSDSKERMKVVSVFVKGVKACLTLHEVRMSEILLYPLVNFTVFVSFVYSVRDLVINGPVDLALDEGGMLWFTDLSEKDKTFALPLIALGLSYGAVEIAVARSQGKLITFFKDFIQSILLLSVPFVTTLPSGVFCYWIPSSCFGIAQSIALRNPAFQKLLKIPPPPSPKR